MDTKRVALVLSEEALAVIDKYSTERKRGEFVAQVLLDYEARQTGSEVGILERIESRLARLERLLSQD